jgi:hypothetical protein
VGWESQETKNQELVRNIDMHEPAATAVEVLMGQNIVGSRAVGHSPNICKTWGLDTHSTVVTWVILRLVFSGVLGYLKAIQDVKFEIAIVVIDNCDCKICNLKIASI